MQQVLPGFDVKVSGQCTDSGGGGTKLALAWVLTIRNMVRVDYLICSCSLHNLQTCLQNVVATVLGGGGMNENHEPVMNVMQMLHSAYNIPNWQETNELKELWTYVRDATDEEFDRLEDPI